MRILYTGTLDSRAGGPAMSAYLTMKGLDWLGCQTVIVMPELKEGGELRGEDVEVRYHGAPIIKKLGWTPDIERVIRDVEDVDIYHAQGVWLWNTYALATVGRDKSKPYLISPRGMLYPQDIAKSSTLFKKLSLRFKLLADLNHAACVHATCEEEMRHCRTLGVKSPICVIPNPVEIQDYASDKKDEVFRVGYLGRLSPRKNVESLIHAFYRRIDELKDAEMLIIGGGDEVYEGRLKGLVEKYGLRNVKFAGFLNGAEKDAALASCSIIVMPSEFENLGNVILEGLVRRKPCIATKGAPWEDLSHNDCGWWVDYAQEAIEDAIVEASRLPRERLEEMGRNGRALVERKYSVEAVARRMKAVYEWVLGRREKPEWVCE